MGRILSAALCFTLCLAPAVARAEDDAADKAAEDATPTPAATVSSKKAAPDIRVFGKVFALAQADERQQYQRDLSIATARLGVKATFGVAQAVIEADVASKSLIKDAYLRLEDADHGLRLYAGQFKAPFLLRELVSSWDLPFVQRGLVTDYVVGTNDLGGRRIGLMGEYRNKQWLGLDVTMGGFQGTKDALGNRAGQDLSARATVVPWKKHLIVGANGYWADANAQGRFDRWAAGGDATMTFHHASVTAEGLFGRIATGHFTGQIVTATYAFRLSEKWGLEPVVGGEGIQQRGAVTGSGKAAVLGLNVHYTDQVKVMLQGERGLFPGDQGLQNRFAVQLAARF